MEVNTDWKSLRIFTFMYLEMSLIWQENEVTMIKESSNKIVKYCLEEKVYKFYKRNALYDLL